jgi:MoaA/NifB/PqqE/SkfB family radical SAM enzyme
MDKKSLLNDSKVFCMAPWVHMHTSPVGNAFSCCIAKDFFGSSINTSLEDLVNSDHMKAMRVDMLAGKQIPTCSSCYQHEQQGIASFRAQFKERFEKDFDEVIGNTDSDGHVNNFKMRYFDIRFNNICNFKCRTCNSNFSSQWEQEDLKRKVEYAQVLPKNNNPEFIKEILDQVPNMEYAYFAGGESLITEEHYLLLEEMIKLGKTDIALSYNSNVSNLKFKNKDIIDLWSKFKKPVEVSASIDHFGARAEYIRHGTDWGEVESNLFKLKKVPNVKLSMNTVVSIFNYVTLADFYQYIIDKGIFTSISPVFGSYSMTSPEHFTAQALPIDLKNIGTAELQKLIERMTVNKFPSSHTGSISSNIKWVYASNMWGTYKSKFQEEIQTIDKVRGENFIKVFPELSKLFD